MTSQYVSQIGYIRTACEEYSLEASDINKQYIHLTNNAIQKFADNYGKFEDGNQMSYAQFEQYVKRVYNKDFCLETLQEKINFIIELTFKSIQHKLEVSSVVYVIDSIHKLIKQLIWNIWLWLYDWSRF